MKRLLFVAGMLFCTGAASAQEYKPAKAPLMTPWGEKVTVENAWREYPRPHLVRGNWENLNGLWDIVVQNKNAELPKEWKGRLLVPFALESALGGVGFHLLEPQESLWYRRTLDVKARKGERLLLHFGAVDFRTQVFINGKEVSDVPHEGGNIPFKLDITDFVKEGANELVVSVWDPTDTGAQSTGKQVLKPYGAIYTRVSGIWQTVWTEWVPASYVEGYRVVTDIDAGTVAVTVIPAGELMGAGAEVEVLRGGKSIAKGKVKGWKTPVVLKVPNAQLWSPETPSLYDLRITLKAPGATDTVTGYFGMRKVEWRKDERGVPRFYVNNKKVYMQGTLDQGWWPDGLLTPPSDEAMAFDIAFLKRVGFNMMRKHIKVEPLRYYYLCDKMGIFVWQDMLSGEITNKVSPEDRYRLYREELKEMMDLLQTFPCIVMWCPYNEGWGQPGKGKTNMTQEWVKRYDPTRLVNGPSGWVDHGVGDTLDMHSYPGPDMPAVMEDRVAVLGEFGGIGLPIEGHTWATGNNWGYVSDKTTEESFARYAGLHKKLARLASSGLAASVYTQTTDIEVETNGLMTYDRKRVKYDENELAKLHQSVYAAAEKATSVMYKPILLSSKGSNPPLTWKYTLEAPPGNWAAPDFDDSAWKAGEAGFGNDAIRDIGWHPEVRVRTIWDKALWIRRDFEFTGKAPELAELDIFYDEDPVIYLNGVEIRRFSGYNTKYTHEELDMDIFRKALRQGRNVIAVKIVNALGGAYIDLGIDEIIEK